MSRNSILNGVVLAFFLTSLAQASSPSLGGIEPRGIQRGQVQELSFNGSRLADAVEILFYDPAGFKVQELKAAAGSVKVKVLVSPDCRMGQHVAQVRTRSGVSEFKTFYVGPFGSIAEKEPNSDFAAPQPIPMNVTVTGSIGTEDVDYFVVDAKKGQRISVEVEAMRLGTALFDPYVAILNSKRFEMASADDSPLVLQDAVASAIAPEDGKYIIEVRESAYGGGNRYRLHVGTFPRPTAVYPAGGKVGEKIEVKFLGDSSGSFTQQVQVPTVISRDFAVHATTKDGVAPTGNPFRQFEHGNVLEKEPNNALAQATPAQLPLAFNGIVDKPGDVDFFKFTAKKGQVFDVHCYARRIRTGLDPVMTVHRANGSALASGDDYQGKPDSYFRVTIPADGDYFVSIRDHLNKGAPDYVYRVEMTPPKPNLTVSIPRVARYSQYRQWIVVPRGNRFASLMTVGRGNFGGPVNLTPKLPKGVKLHAEMPITGSTIPVVFEAAADAPVGGGLINFAAAHADPKTKIVGGYNNNADFIRGAPGQSIYWSVNTRQIPVVVVDEVPFKLDIVEPKVPIVRNGTMSLKIKVTRKEGFTAAINVQLPFRPPGIGANSSITIPAGKNEAIYPLSANSGASIRKWRIYALGSANVNGTAWVSSQLATLEIAAPYFTFNLQRADAEQGKATEMVCKVTQARPFDGTAKVQLLDLPPNVATKELDFTKDTKELLFPITVAKNAKPGTHKNVFCRVQITDNGEPVMHSRLAGSEFRVDTPPPPKKVVAKPKPMPKVAVAKKPMPKPPVKKVVRLTRLQKLRLKAKEKAAGTEEAPKPE